MASKNTDKWDAPAHWTPINMERAGAEERRIRLHIQYIMGRQRGDPDVVGRRLDPATTPVQRPERTPVFERGTPFHAPKRGRPKKVRSPEDPPARPRGRPRKVQPAEQQIAPAPDRSAVSARGVRAPGPRATAATRIIAAIRDLDDRAPGFEQELRAQLPAEAPPSEPVGTGTSARERACLRKTTRALRPSTRAIRESIEQQREAAPERIPPAERRRLRQKALRDVDADIIESKPVRNGRTGIPKRMRNKIRAAVRRHRRRNPKLTAIVCKARVEREFGVRITMANFYPTYWSPKTTEPA